MSNIQLSISWDARSIARKQSEQKYDHDHFWQLQNIFCAVNLTSLECVCFSAHSKCNAKETQNQVIHLSFISLPNFVGCAANKWPVRV